MWEKKQVFSSSASLLLILFLLCHCSIVQGRRTPPSSGRDSSCTNGNFYDTTFCGIAKTVTSPSNCTRIETFSEIVCPSQNQVCNRNFNLTSHCTDKFSDCAQECERYLDMCCETQCCQDSCLDPQILCTIMEVATCRDGKAEICPCTSADENRTAAEFCNALVGEADCQETCLDFVDQCCYVSEGDLRLTQTTTYPTVDGDRITGRLELFKDGQWGLVCRDSFGLWDATVACRQLGYHDKEVLVDYGGFSNAADLPFLINYVGCTGDENKLVDCPYSTRDVSYVCDSYDIIGVDCFIAPLNFTEGQARLSKSYQSGNYSSGLLQIFTDGEWGHFCGTVDHAVSNVACRQLGYFEKGSQSYSDYTGSTSTMLTGYGVECNGNEVSLLDCQLPSFHYGTCYRLSYVVCLLEQESGFEGELRFLDTDTEDGVAFGRLETYHDGAWGRVCSFGNDGPIQVVCRQLGYHDKGSFVTTSYNRDPYTLPLVEYIGCNGTEAMLSECTIDVFSNGYCNYPAEINCLVQPEFGLAGDLRLSENITSQESNRVSGRLEVYTNGAWGAVCSDSFGLQEARVACRQLGFSDQGSYWQSIESEHRVQGMNRVGCSGDEARLTDCSFQASRPTVCSNGVGLVCSIQQENGTVGDLRLEDASEDDYIISGRLEVFNGSWGSVCWDYYFGMDEALVVCSQLGYFGPVFDAAYIAWLRVDLNITPPVWMNNVVCSGEEDNVTDCAYDGLSTDPYCYYSRNRIGLRCWKVDPETVTGGMMRLADTTETSTTIEGRLEISILGEWGSLCNDEFDLQDARVACRHLGYSDEDAETLYGSNGQSSSDNLLTYHFECDGDEANLLVCRHTFFDPGSYYCYGESVAVKCVKE